MQKVFNLDTGIENLERLFQNGWKVVFVVNANSGKSTYLILEKK